MLSGLAFIVVRGPALAGKTAVARAVAERLAADGRRKVALISHDDLATRWIAGHDPDFAAETELVYRQMKLLAAAYVRAGYNVVVDGAFAGQRDGVTALHESDLRDLLALVATIPNVRPLLVNVTAPLESLLGRARNAGWPEEAVEASHREFERGAAASPVTFDTSRVAPEDAARATLDHLGVRP